MVSASGMNLKWLRDLVAALQLLAVYRQVCRDMHGGLQRRRSKYHVRSSDGAALHHLQQVQMHSSPGIKPCLSCLQQCIKVGADQAAPELLRFRFGLKRQLKRKGQGRMHLHNSEKLMSRDVAVSLHGAHGTCQVAALLPLALAIPSSMSQFQSAKGSGSGTHCSLSLLYQSCRIQHQELMLCRAGCGQDAHLQHDHVCVWLLQVPHAKELGCLAVLTVVLLIHACNGLPRQVMHLVEICVGHTQAAHTGIVLLFAAAADMRDQVKGADGSGGTAGNHCPCRTCKLLHADDHVAPPLLIV